MAEDYGKKLIMYGKFSIAQGSEDCFIVILPQGVLPAFKFFEQKILA